jgi:hypothetical protein
MPEPRAQVVHSGSQSRDADSLTKETFPTSRSPSQIAPPSLLYSSRSVGEQLKANEQPSKTQLYKNNKLTSYTFRPSRGHLQADI